MRPFQVFKQSFRYFIRKPMLIVTFVGVAFIPTLYSGFLIKGTWDPYGKLNSLPVAVVNLDEGAVSDGKPMNVGQDFVAELKKNTSFNWSFVSEDEAIQGMKGNHYYASITIPPHFSQDVASLAGDQPKQAEIVFESNSYYNFVAGQISENATRELKDKLSQNLTEAYSRSIYTQFETLASGLSEAGDGAARLNAGASQLAEGIGKANTNLSALSKGASELNSGMGLLQDGASALRSGASQLESGTTEWSASARKLEGAGLQLQEGATKAEQGAAALSSGLQDAKNAADRLTAGLQSSAAGSEQLKDGLQATSSALGDLSSGSALVADGLGKAMDENADLAADPQMQKLLAASLEVAKGTKELLAGNKQLEAGSTTLNEAQKQLLEGGSELSSGQNQLLEGASELRTGQKQLADGLTQYRDSFGKLVDGSDKLAQGAGQLSNGANDLGAGLGKMAAGTGEVADGAKQLDEGTAQLNEGAMELAGGTGELADKLTEASEETSSIGADDEIFRMLAAPVTIKANNERKVTIYGYGIAPYFISMALFAGALVFTTIISARNTVVEGAVGIPAFVSKTLTFGLISLAQSLIAVTILVYILGLEVQSVPLFYAYTAIVGLAFMFIVQAIVTWLDLPGRFVVLILMIFQLASSAGTFPLELLPDWAKAMNPWLPMTYSIRGFRDVISSGDYNHMWMQAGRLAIYLAAFLILTLLYFLKREKGHSEEQVMPVKV